MPRPKALVPALRYHVSGQSVCEINGTTYYLGLADSPESIARYAVLIREKASERATRKTGGRRQSSGVRKPQGRAPS